VVTDPVLSGNPDQREEGITPSVGQRRSVWRCRLAYGADRPVRGDPFAGGVGQHGGEIDDAGGLVDRRGLCGGDLMLA
jgi:hypothetical protein